MKRALLALCAGLLTLSCSDDRGAGTIGTGNTAGVAGVAFTTTGLAGSASVHVYKVGDLSTPVASTVADSQGHFAVDSLAEGAYLIFVDQGGQQGMISDTVRITGTDTAKVSISLQPYTLVYAGSNLSYGYCGVSQNPLLAIDSVNFWRVPHVTFPLTVVSMSDTMLSARWDASTSVASLFRKGELIATDTLHFHVDTMFAGGVQRPMYFGNNSTWFPSGDRQLHIGVHFKLGDNPKYPVMLAKLDDSTNVTLDAAGVITLKLGQVSGPALTRKSQILSRAGMLNLDWFIDRRAGLAVLSVGDDLSKAKLSLELGNLAFVPGSIAQVGSSTSDVTLYGAGIHLLGAWRKTEVGN